MGHNRRAAIIDNLIRLARTAYSEDPVVRGGETNYGITQRAWDDYWPRQYVDEDGCWVPAEVRDITEEQARAFYRHEHVVPFLWVSHHGLRDLAIDSSVNHGRYLTTRWLQSAADVTADGIVGPITTRAVNARPHTCYTRLLVSRLKCYADIAASDETQTVFLRGWINRICEFVR